MKKAITVFLIFLVLFNFITTFSYAAGGETTNTTTVTGNAVLDDPDLLELTPQRTGNAEVTNDDGKTLNVSVNGSTYSGAQIFKIIVDYISAILLKIRDLMVKLVGEVAKVTGGANQIIEFATEESANDEEGTLFTVYDTVMGNYEVFNIDFSNGISDEGDSSILGGLKKNMRKYFNYTRNMAIALSLFVLVYIGIRMLISTVASQKADYKRMLIDWFISLVILFSMQYLIVLISVVLNKLLEVFSNIAQTWKIENFEYEIYKIALEGINSKGFNAFSGLALLGTLTWYQVKFFLYYVKRLMEVYVLVIISPLVTVTYAMDKAGDSKAQAFSAFLEELISKSSIQAVHAILYVAFVSTAGAIAQSQPLLAIVFFSSLGRSEKILRKIFAITEEKGMNDMSVPFLEN